MTKIYGYFVGKITPEEKKIEIDIIKNYFRNVVAY